MKQFLTVKNNERVAFSMIPELDYEEFLKANIALMQNECCHCASYFAIPERNEFKLICCIADDSLKMIYVSSSKVKQNMVLPSFSNHHLAFEKFEREIFENYGIKFTDHPWLKPVRYSFSRADKNEQIENYPFYFADSEELHEVGVGPVHAGIIEPGHFRFICDGEKILHLEIQLGYQHRGIESLFLKKGKLHELHTLAESIAGDTVVGHTTAFANLWESLCGAKIHEHLNFSRTLAMELERMAIHTGDLAAISADIAYQLGNSVLGRLRTPLVNFFQQWCGNRLAKSLIRAGHSYFPFNNQLAANLSKILDDYERDFCEICNQLFSLPSALARLEKTGTLNRKDALAIGVVGPSARMCNIFRDIRSTHPHNLYVHKPIDTVLKHHGDVYSRAQIRKEEILVAIKYIKELINVDFDNIQNFDKMNNPVADSFVISLVEGWRGEICHCAITGDNGQLLHYKIKDPSFHNWLALALAVRNNEISDFPVCNKSFNLSYCGHDL